MHLSHLATALLLLGGNALASKPTRAGFKKLPGDTELMPCGGNEKLTPEFAQVTLKEGGNATLTVILQGSHVGKSTGSLYVYDSSSQDVLEEIDFNLCSSFLVKGKCPLDGMAEGVLEFSTFGKHLWSLDLGLDIFSKNKQILCVYGQAAPTPKDDVLKMVEQEDQFKWEM